MRDADVRRIQYTMAPSKIDCIEYCESVVGTVCCHYMDHNTGIYNMCNDDGCFCGAYRSTLPTTTDQCGSVASSKFAEICQMTEVEVTREPTSAPSRTCNVQKQKISGDAQHSCGDIETYGKIFVDFTVNHKNSYLWRD